MYGTDEFRRSLAYVSPQAVKTAIANPGKALYYGRYWVALTLLGRVSIPRYSAQTSTEYLFRDSEIDRETLDGYLDEVERSDFIATGQRRLSDLEFFPAPPQPRCLGLYVLTRHYEPETVLETGVFHGASTLYVLEALRRNGHGHLYSIDVHPDAVDWWNPDVPDDFEPGWIVPDELRDRWTLRLGKAQTELEPLLEEIPPVDLFYHDSNHDYEHKRFEFESVLEHMDGGIISSHDIGRNNDASACRAFVELCEELGEPYHTHRPFEPGDRGPGVFGYVRF